MVDEHNGWTSIIAWVPFNEGWGEWDRDDTGRIADDGQGAGPDPAGQRAQRRELLQLQGRLRQRRRHRLPPVPRPGDAGARTRPGWRSTASTAASASRCPGHMWFGDGHAYEMAPDPATLTAGTSRTSRTCSPSAQQLRHQRGRSTPRSPTSRTSSTASSPTTGRSTKMDFAQVRAVNEMLVRRTGDDADTADGSGGDPHRR